MSHDSKDVRLLSEQPQRVAEAATTVLGRAGQGEAGRGRAPTKLLSNASVEAAPGLKDVASVCIRTIQLLVGNGQTTEHGIRAVVRIARCFGFQASVAPGWGEATLRLENDDLISLEFIVTPPPVIVDIAKVAAVMEVGDALCEGCLDLCSALARLDRIAVGSSLSASRLVVMAAAGAAALGVIFGAADATFVMVIAVVAGCGAVFRLLLRRVSANTYLQPFGGALLAGLVGAACARYGLGKGSSLVAFCPCMVLLPGPHLLGGSLDLAQARLPLGAARVLHATLVSLGICIGLVLGLSLGGVDLQPFVAPQAPVPLPEDVLAAGIAVAAFGSFFAVPWRLLPIPVATGMTAHALHWTLAHTGAGLALSAFVASLLVGTVMTLVANRSRLPFCGGAFAAVVSMIPGVYMFRMAGGLMTLVQTGVKTPPGILMGVVADGTTAVAVILAIGSGLIVPTLLIDK